MKKIIVILGMHRSGTSAITKGLESLDIDLKESDSWYAKGENDKGFWEDPDIVEINEKVLTKLGLNWSTLTNPALTYDQLDHLEDELSLAIQLINKKTRNNDLYSFKDPRTSILLPFWKTIFNKMEINPFFIVAIRHPRSVSQSLMKRSRFPEIKSSLIWTNYNQHLITHIQNSRHILIDYDTLMKEPEQQINRLSSFLKIPINKEKMNRYCSVFLDNNLRHSIYELDNKHKTSQEKIYETLKNYSNASDKNRVEYNKIFDDSFSYNNELIKYINYLEETPVTIKQKIKKILTKN